MGVAVCAADCAAAVCILLLIFILNGMLTVALTLTALLKTNGTTARARWWETEIETETGDRKIGDCLLPQTLGFKRFIISKQPTDVARQQFAAGVKLTHTIILCVYIGVCVCICRLAKPSLTFGQLPACLAAVVWPIRTEWHRIQPHLQVCTTLKLSTNDIFLFHAHTHTVRAGSLRAEPSCCSQVFCLA